LHCTTDAGLTWLSKQIPINPSMTISFWDKNHYTVGGYSQTISTTDGGITWSSPDSQYVNSISYGDSNNILTAEYERVNKSTNSGSTWTYQQLACGENPFLRHKDRNNVFVGGLSGGSGVLFRSTNGGEVWSAVTLGNYPVQAIINITFFDSLSGAIAGAFGRIYRTSDGGITWYQYSNTGTYEVLSAFFTDINNCTAVGPNGYIAKTTDGGVTWKRQISNTQFRLRDVAFIDQNHGFITGDNGLVLGTNDGGGDPVITPVELISFKGKTDNKGVRLEWETASETNNLSFNIQRSTDGMSFYNVGNVKGSGTSAIKHQYEFSEGNLLPGSYFYRLKQLDYNGTFMLSDIIRITITNLDKYTLLQNYPNPFNPTTKIEYSIPERSIVSLKVYDILGREVAELVNGSKEVGNYEVNFDGLKLVSGLYVYTLRAGSFSESKKMILIK